MLSLKRPLCCFDLETTGTDVVKDRIVEIGAIKLMPDGQREAKRWLINPGIPIPAEVSAIHGIYDADVADQPRFFERAREIAQFIGNSDLAGFNSNKFDLPMLAEEFERARVDHHGPDIDLSDRRSVDAMNIFHRMEPRNLTAAYKFYCDKELVDAHSALADTEATLEVLLGQVERYQERFVKLEEFAQVLDVEFLSRISNRGDSLDYAGYIRRNTKGNAYFSFGKYKNTEVAEVLRRDPGYYDWILGADFPLYTKRVMTRIKLELGRL